jgi:hypothetical protein
MGRPYGSGRVICESCIWIDVRRWHREGRLHARATASRIRGPVTESRSATSRSAPKRTLWFWFTACATGEMPSGSR